jgi:hypothetical protein
MTSSGRRERRRRLSLFLLKPIGGLSAYSALSWSRKFLPERGCISRFTHLRKRMPLLNYPLFMNISGKILELAFGEGRQSIDRPLCILKAIGR